MHHDRRKAPRGARASAIPMHQRVCYATHVEGHGEAMYHQAVAEQVEGIFAKRADSPYKAGRTRDWVKIETPIGRQRESKRMGHRR